jgi:tellurite resistance protein TerC
MSVPDIPPPFIWTGFILLIVGLIAVDLLVSRNHPEGMGVKQAIRWSIFWIVLSVVFGFGVWWASGPDLAAQYFTGYLLEKTLSVDNLFVFLLIFRAFQVPKALQHRVLTWGIMGALVLRAIMILAGIELLHAWHPIIYVFGGFLILTGAKTLFGKDEDERDIAEGRVVRLAERLVPFVPRYEGRHFFTRIDGRRVGTMLFLVLVVVEATDVVFAVDSIPAILAITDDPFIVFSSNILAILGLRALFFTIASLLTRLRFLRHGLGIILILIGVKMCLSDVIRIPPLLSFGVTVAILGITVAVSLIWTLKHPELVEPEERRADV